jgi:hypothetical protein
VGWLDSWLVTFLAVSNGDDDALKGGDATGSVWSSGAGKELAVERRWPVLFVLDAHPAKASPERTTTQATCLQRRSYPTA